MKKEKSGLEELGEIQIIGPEDENFNIEELMDKYGKIKPYMPEAIRHLPMPLQHAILAFRDGKYPDENGVLREMGGYEDEYDIVWCLSEVEDCIVFYSKTRQALEEALRFLGLKTDHIRQYDRLFDLAGNKMEELWP